MYEVEFKVSLDGGLQLPREFLKLLIESFGDASIRELSICSGKPEKEGHVVRFDVLVKLRVDDLGDVYVLFDGFGSGKLEVSRTPSLDGQTFDQLMIEELDFGVRTYNCLKRGGVQTVADLLERSEADLSTIVNIGPKNIKEVVDFLASKGLQLKQ
ncbi:MAG: DNA-directed RNA polymerase subunit alpha C-terminal domain-containing protein [Patescibacteria group bacterium]